MKELFSIDLKDYDPNDSVFRRPSARAVIIKDNIIAMVYSVKERYYKFPGGGIKDGEDISVALAREVKEEVGLVVKPESISEFGSVMRRQKSNYTDNTIFEQENYYFWCECEENVVDQNLDDYEKEAEFILKYVDIDEAIKVNSEYKSDDFFDEIMIQREKKVLELVKIHLGR
ncbi:MAG: NUDIX domain-containing protein [Lachnospiraceae bacterium]|nr:NUDIX domain-containing protein [Lachnospiraceae bacterium]